MHILSIAVSHASASLDLRERLAFDEDQIRSSLSRLGCGHEYGDISELIILSTCNRTEVYAVSNQTIFPALGTFLSETRGVPREEFAPYLEHRQDAEAIRHLFYVAAGLDSLVIGEPQILGQLVRALELSRGQNMAGPVLNRLFQSAIHGGKRARTETGISRNSASISSLAASLAERVVHPIAGAQVVILGAGEMAELAVEALRKRGVNRILVVNRTLARARLIAERWGAQVSTFEDLDACIATADILVSSTGAPHTIVSAEMVKRAMAMREERPLFLIDIAVPRDIESDAAQIPHVKLFDIDGLNAKLEHSLAERMAEVPQVESILEQEIAEFSEYMKSAEIIPIIADIRQQAEGIRQEELEKTLRHLPELTAAERSRIEAMTLALVKKLLASPTTRLRTEATSPRALEFAAVTRSLFDLPGSPSGASQPTNASSGPAD